MTFKGYMSSCVVKTGLVAVSCPLTTMPMMVDKHTRVEADKGFLWRIKNTTAASAVEHTCSHAACDVWQDWYASTCGRSRFFSAQPSPRVTLVWCLVLCFRYGKIVSTKAILDKTTNKCKGEFCHGCASHLTFCKTQTNSTFRNNNCMWVFFPQFFRNVTAVLTHVWFPGYGFVDFDSPAAAQKAVTALKSSGVQAQMAKVRFSSSAYINILHSDLPFTVKLLICGCFLLTSCKSCKLLHDGVWLVLVIHLAKV